MDAPGPPAPRPARLSDGEALARLWSVANAGDAPGQRPPTYGITDALDAITNADTFVVQHGLRLVGGVVLCHHGSRLASLTEGRGEAQINLLGVRADARGAGIGRSLLQRCQLHAQDRGERALVLWAHADMEAARHLCESLGFARLPTRDWAPDGVMRLVYRLEL